LDEALEVVVASTFLDVKTLREILARQREARQVPNNAAALKLDLAKAKLPKLDKVYIYGRMSETEYEAERRRIEAEIRALEPAINRVPILDDLELAKTLAAAFAEFPHLHFQDKQKLLKKAIQTVEVRLGRIQNLRLNPTFLAASGGAKLGTVSGIRADNNCYIWRMYSLRKAA
jgi:hypothetical protein